ncbi:MAG: hypothetical protein ACTSW1_09495 [Candidatus Hodarchaeales archaeon]
MFSAYILFMNFIGFGLAFEFIYRSRDTRFKYIALGWLSWITGTLAFLFSNGNIIINDLVYILNSILNSLGTFLIVIGIIHYFHQLSFYRVVLPITIFLILHPFVVYFLTGFNIIYPTISSLFCCNVILIVLLVLGIKYRNSTKKNMFFSSDLFWLVLTVLLSLFHVIFILIGLIELFSQDDIFLHLFIVVSYIILLIHIEHNTQTSEKFSLKDSYSHSLGNILQIILSAQQLQKDLKTHSLSEKEKDEMESLVEEKWNEASELLKEIREL